MRYGIFLLPRDYPLKYNIMENQESTDQAWEEYLSTGIDPTGGELGPDFDPETGEPLEE